MKKRGQSILEYSVLFVVIAGILLVVVPLVFRPKVQRIYEASGNILDIGSNLTTLAGPGPVANNTTP